MIRFLGKSLYLILILLFLLTLGSHQASSQIYILEDTARNLNAKQALNLFETGQAAELTTKKFNPGFTTSVFWLMIKSNYSAEERLVIGNAHINKIDYFKVNTFTRKIDTLYLTGDHRSFHSRPINNPNFIFPLEKADTNTIWLAKIDKHHESLQLSVQVLELNDFSDQSSTSSFINGAMTGIMILILLLGGFLFIVTKNSVYAYYVLYIILAWLWLFSDKGYGFQYLWPEFPYFATRSRPFFYSLSCMGLLQFMRVFIDLQKSSKYYSIINWTLVWFLLQAIIALFPFRPDENGNVILLIYLTVVTPSGIVALAIMGLSIYKRIREGSLLAKYYLVSVSVFISFSVLEILSHNGFKLVTSAFFSNFGIHTGLILEAIILFYGLAIQFNTYRKDREQLLIDINATQEKLTTKVFEAHENERKKIADQLHDEVGSMLSVVSLNISSLLEKKQEHPQSQIKLESAFEALGSAANLVRNISHTLTPIAIEKYGFKRAIDNLIASINTSQKLKIENVVIGFDQTNQYSNAMLNDVFRSIQEIVSNIIKHSGATRAYLELIEHDDAISLIIEDNGIGMPKNVKHGNGLENIFSRINYFKGTIDINSSKETGTLIVIEIPTHHN